jgi:predicted nucleotidyltransferase component of viral defense system
MNDAVKAMLQTYGAIKGPRDEDNALKEIIQSISLLGLHRGGFFEKACFYGGTALRILYDLDRFSEDMDFCLVEKDSAFKLNRYFDSIQHELERFGFDASIQEKRTGSDVPIESAFVKQETSSGLLTIGRDSRRAQKGQLIKVKLEVDKTNPLGFVEAKKLIKLPVPFMVATLNEESLFAGKLHALLARAYTNRVKGRDYYDFLFYMTRRTKVNMAYLESKLRDSGHYSEPTALDRTTLISLLTKKFAVVDFEKAKNDVIPFIRPEREADLAEWSCELFSAMAKDIMIDERQVIK